MLLRAQKSMIDGPRFLVMALYPRVCLNATLLQHILQSLQDFEVALNTSYSSSVVPMLKSYFTIEGEFLKLLVENPTCNYLFFNFHYWYYHSIYRTCI